jgi:uncharacterized protein
MLPECPIHAAIRSTRTACPFTTQLFRYFSCHEAAFIAKREYLLISGYGNDHILINGIRHETSLILLPDEVISGWASTSESMSATFRHSGDACAGNHSAWQRPKLRFPAAALYAGLIKANIGVEVMDTPAAVAPTTSLPPKVGGWPPL